MDSNKKKPDPEVPVQEQPIKDGFNDVLFMLITIESLISKVIERIKSE